MPFKSGEKLSYKLYWSKMNVGTFRSDIKKDRIIDGKAVWHFTMLIQTNKKLDKIYPVRDYLSAFCQKDVKRSLKYSVNQNEGKTQRIINLNFDWDKKQLTYIKNGKVRRQNKLKKDYIDPLSLFHALRSLDLKIGKTEIIKVTDGKVFVEAKINVIKNERIKIGKKEYDCILIQPDISNLKGVFEKSKDAVIKIWLSNDERKIPLKFSSKVVIGEFYAELENIDKLPGNKK
ncbi:MAG: DUF3108 domain-containing protein [Lentisphaeria bacterium]|nr:DUF3108 domain-containing protein [Lentisphaeria bacterium]